MIPSHITRSRHITRLDPEKRIVYGEVYVPFDPDPNQTYSVDQVALRVDSYDTFMRRVTLERLAHQYMEFMRNVDLQHDRESRAGVPVESYIARDDDPVFLPGAWIMGTRVDDDEVWDRINQGEITGYSIDVMARQESVSVNVGNTVRQYGELIDVTPFFVSLVDRAANKRTFRVIRCDHTHLPTEEPVKDVPTPPITPVQELAATEESRRALGFMEHVRRFFAGDAGKPDATSALRSIDFADDWLNREPWDQLSMAMNLLYEVTYQIIQLPLSDRANAVQKASGDWARVITDIMGKIPEANSEQRSERRELVLSQHSPDMNLTVRIGRKISDARMQRIKKALEELTAVVVEVEGVSEEDRSMSENTHTEEKWAQTTSALEGIMAEVKGLSERLVEIEGKQSAKPDLDPELRGELKKVADLIEGMSDRLKRIEDRRSPSQQSPSDERNAAEPTRSESRSVFSGILARHQTGVRQARPDDAESEQANNQ